LALQITQNCRRRYLVGDSLYALGEAAVAGGMAGVEEAASTRSNCPEIRALHAEVFKAREVLQKRGGFLRWAHAFSHAGLTGNEAADKAAGKGAKQHIGDTKINLYLPGWQFSYNDQQATGGALHRLLWQQHAQTWNNRAQREPRHHAAYVTSALNMRLVGKWAKANVPAPQYMATLKVRFGAIVTHERRMQAEPGAMLHCPCCARPLPGGAFTQRSDVAGHLAHHCEAEHPGRLRAFRAADLHQWSTKWGCPLAWGGLTQAQWVAGGQHGDADAATDSDLHALVDCSLSDPGTR